MNRAWTIRRAGAATARAMVRSSTYLRWVYLMLGAALVLAFLLVDSGLAAIAQDAAGPPALRFAFALTVIAVPPVALGLLPAVREVEAVAVESLLGVRFAERPIGPARSWPQRRRTAAWFVLHLLTGGLVGFATVLGLPFAMLLVAAPFRDPARHYLLPGVPYRTGGGWADAWLPAVGVLMVLCLPLLAAGAGAVLARWAPAVLGPTAVERIELLERRTTMLVERNRLARELHDSVGHALSLVTLQAGAARRVLDTDPEFARTALGAMEESARAALTDLDHVLGLLRDEQTSTLPQLTLGDLPKLLDATRAVGVRVDADVDAGLDAIPAVVSREAYRIVQEGLTNAVRHAGTPPGELAVTLAVRSSPGSLRLRLTNPVRSTGKAGRTRGGRGLAGIRERVGILRGTVDSGQTGGGWRLDVTLPTGPRTAPQPRLRKERA
ncbi:MAG TPA: histidine kinase [Kribbellaceae bacterium]|nr:histidine kinase [Kribbellaceae bacterium]